MGSAIGGLLPLALGVAISPVPIIVVILMLLSPHASVTSVAFLVGWVLGVTVVVLVVVAVIGPVDDSEADDPSTLVSTLQLVLGAAAVLLAGRQWHARARAGQEPAVPGWMAAVDTFTPVKGLGLGALLAGVNPKNLTLCVAGGVTIGANGLSAGETAVAVAVFVAVASCSVGVPVVGYLAARERMQQPLDDLRGWLTVHNAAVMSVLLLVIGVSLVGKGLADG